MSVPRVYAAITAVIGELSTNGIGKRHINARDRYEYRSIDDLYERLSPLLASHRLCILPRIRKRFMVERQDEHGRPVVSVTVKGSFDIVSAEDGSRHVIEGFGEALDAGDKGTAKAMTAAYKSALFQAFCIPAAGSEDADAQSIRLGAVAPGCEPAGGWTRWGEALLEAVAACDTRDAIDALQDANRDLLRSAAMHDVRIYGRIGEAIRARRREVEPLASTISNGKSAGSRTRQSRRKIVADAVGAHA